MFIVIRKINDATDELHEMNSEVDTVDDVMPEEVRKINDATDELHENP